MAILVVNIRTSERTEDEINKFYGTLENATFRSKLQEILLIIWNLNTKAKYEAKKIVKWSINGNLGHKTCTEK